MPLSNVKGGVKTLTGEFVMWLPTAPNGFTFCKSLIRPSRAASPVQGLVRKSSYSHDVGMRVFKHRMAESVCVR